MTVWEAIKKRRSVRRFKRKAVPYSQIKKILEAGRWAPSGLNNQPWKFMVLEKDLKDMLTNFTHYGHIIKGADRVILVFLDKNCSYHYGKDLMALGACIQNMLLCIHELRLGACWLGEILNKRDQIHTKLNVSDTLELEAVIALGKPFVYPKQGKRKKLKELLISPSNE